MQNKSYLFQQPCWQRSRDFRRSRWVSSFKLNCSTMLESVQVSPYTQIHYLSHWKLQLFCCMLQRVECFFSVFTLRYMKYLYPYECAKKKLSTPAELQAAIDGNRRDSRRSFGSFLSQAMPSETTHAYSSPSPTTTPPAFTASSPPGISNRSSPGSGPGPSTSNHDVSVCLGILTILWTLSRNINTRWINRSFERCKMQSECSMLKLSQLV